MKNRTIYCKDNLEVMRSMEDESIDLIYLDPPFNKGQTFTGANGASFRDKWTEEDVTYDQDYVQVESSDEVWNFLEYMKGCKNISNWAYLIFMAARLLECHRILKDTGSIYYHCDHKMNYYIRMLMDTIFGEKNYLNEIVWKTIDTPAAVSKKLRRGKDYILRYSKSSNVYANTEKMYIRNLVTKEDLKKYQKDADGKYFYSGGTRSHSDEAIDRKLKDGSVYICNSGSARIKLFLEQKGDKYYRIKRISDIWNDINGLTFNKERVGYPTQKPLKLLERIISLFCSEDGVVLDPFCGSGTTCLAAEILGRQWIGIDKSPDSYTTIKERFTKEIEKETEILGFITKIDHSITYIKE